MRTKYRTCVTCGTTQPREEFIVGEDVVGKPIYAKKDCNSCRAAGVRRCTYCGTVKPITQFMKTEQCVAGVSRAFKCNVCHAQYVQLYKDTHPEFSERKRLHDNKMQRERYWRNKEAAAEPPGASQISTTLTHPLGGAQLQA